MTLWRIYINYCLVDVAMFYSSVLESDVIEFLIKYGGFDSSITIIKTQ